MSDPTPFQALVHKRRSIRKYQDKPIPREVILDGLDAARWAPSAENVQPWRFVIVDEPGVKDALCARAFSGIYFTTKWAARAPVILVVLARLDVKANRIGAWLQGIPFYLLDIGAAIEHFILRMMEQDIGTCWLGWFNVDGVREVLKIPPRYHIVSMVSLGYIERWPRHEKPRHPVDEIAWFNECR
jgi:nitroreductase